MYRKVLYSFINISMKNQYTLCCMNVGQPLEFKSLWDFFIYLSVGRLYPNVEKYVPAEYVAVVLLVKFCNGESNKENS